MQSPKTVSALTELGRVRLSKSFFMREMLHSEIAAMHGLLNVPDDPDLAIAAGTRLCEDLLEPLQERWGRIAIRSAYRSREVNAFGNRMQREKKPGYTCASNEKNAARHIWDMRDANGHMGAMACVVVPAFYDAHPEAGGWHRGDNIIPPRMHARLCYYLNFSRALSTAVLNKHLTRPEGHRRTSSLWWIKLKLSRVRAVDNQPRFAS